MTSPGLERILLEGAPKETPSQTQSELYAGCHHWGALGPNLAAYECTLAIVGGRNPAPGLS